MRVVERVAGAVVGHRRIAVVVVLLAILSVGAGISQVEETSTLQQFEIGVEEEAALESVESNFTAGSTNRTVVQVIVRDRNVLEKETLVATLELQRAIRANETVAPTLAEERRTVGIANVIARAAIAADRPDERAPTLEAQIATLESMDQREIDAVARAVLDERRPGSAEAFALLPTDYEPGSTNASATMVVVFQEPEGVARPGTAPDAVVDSQRAVQALAARHAPGESALVVGNGLLTAEADQARQDTFRLVGPFALLFVLVALVLVYRDLADVLVSLAGVALVQLWTFGALGWLGIAFNPVLVAIPVLLLGLSIDYGIHVFMRYREARTETGEGPVASMRRSLAGVGTALVWVTVTTIVGFLSNLASPVPPVRDLGTIAAVGIVGALVVFGLFVPPLKVELDALLARAGFARDQRPLGSATGRLAGLLSVGARAARTAPVVVVVGVLLLTGFTTVVATDVSTSFEPEDNVAGAPPAWTDHLPATVAPGEYTAKRNLRVANDRFVRHDSTVEILVRGDLTRPDALERLARAEAAAGERDVAVRLADGDPLTESPLGLIRRVAARDPAFRRTVAAADTDGNGVPDRNLERVYDALYETAPDRAARVLHRTDDGAYAAARLTVAVESDADGAATVAQFRDVARQLEGDGLTATATGEPIVSQLIQDYLLETLLVSLLVTVAVVISLLAVAYRLVHGSAVLGAVTVLPVAFTVSWIVATMHAVGYPLSVLTTIVASITIGIGIDYSIHVSDRFVQELATLGRVDAAIARTVRGTGAALLGSAVTTAAGFGVLAVALLPPLRQFGTITAIMIAYAFLGSVLVLPSLLVLWARHLGPGAGAPAGEPAAGRPAGLPED